MLLKRELFLYIIAAPVQRLFDVRALIRKLLVLDPDPILKKKMKEINTTMKHSTARTRQERAR